MNIDDVKEQVEKFEIIYRCVLFLVYEISLLFGSSNDPFSEIYECPP